MFSKYVYRCVVLIAGLLFANFLFAQTLPVKNYTGLGNVGVVSEGDDVCPSISGTPSTSKFRVEVNTTDAGNPYFEWVVYGGTIINDNGNTLISNEADAPQSVDGVPYFYLSHDSYTSDTHSEIIVEWHNVQTIGADSVWIAVRQFSEWGCTDGDWSVFTQVIFNEPPVLTLPDDPDILLGYGQRENFILPIDFVEFYDPDACPLPLTLTFSITHPSGGNTSGTYDSGDASSHTVNLEVGDNIVAWTASDGHKQTSVQYTITVDQSISIRRVAWQNPTCHEVSDGKLYVHDVVASTAADILYRVNSGDWQASNLFNGLAAGIYNIEMQVEYDNESGWGPTSNHTETTTDAYSITLQAMAENVVSSIPSQNDVDNPLDDDPGLTINFTSCFDSEDGSIVIDPLSPLNSSLLFNGSSHQMPINLSYNQTFDAITVAAWIKTTSNSGGPIVSFDQDHYFQLRVTAGAGNCFAWFQTPDGSVTSTKLVNDGQWHLVVGVYNGVTGNITVYVDGYPTQGSSLGTGTIGNASVTRWGYIGRRSDAATFGTTTSGNYYSGQIADVAIYEALAFDSAAVDGMMREGLGGSSHRWLLSHTPASLTAGTQFSDLIDMAGGDDYWARFMNSTGYPAITNNAPVLKQWNLAESLPGLYIYDLDLGTYQLTVKDVLGCGEMTETYEIRSGDESTPFFLTNSALFRTAVLSDVDGTNHARLAVDGMLGTTGYAGTPGVALNEWWQVDLGETRTVHRVKIWLNTARSNFRIALSQDGVNITYVLQDYTDADINYHEITVNGTAGRNGRFLHIIDISDPTALALQISEVEVWTNQAPVTRKFYLGNGQCTYTVNNALDGSINPIPWDVCGGATGYYLDTDGITELSTINGLELSLNVPVTINWIIEDNNPIPNTDNVDIVYQLLDTIPPSFVNPLPNDTTVLTWCDVQNFNIEIPDYDDNYVCLGNSIIESIKLFKGTTLLETLTYPDGLDPNGNDSLTIASSILTQGHHNLIWVLTDMGGNTARDTMRVYVQTRPRVVNATRVNATCNGMTDGQVIVWNIVKDATETDVEYWLVKGADTIKSNHFFIDVIPPGTYQLSINVNGCESAPFTGGVSITEPPATTIIETLFPPACYINENGAIEVRTNGGDIYNSLHFPGDAGSGLSTDYATLGQMTNEGTVEAWIYLDTLSTDNVNSNAAFISKGAAPDDFVLQMEGGVLTFKVTNASDVEASVNLAGITEKQWYHVAGTWDSDGNIALYVHNASGLIGSDGNDTFSGPAKATGGLRLGSQSSGAAYTKLHGFMRNARLWERALSQEEIYMNLRLNSPIDPAFSCVANFPMTNTLINYNGTAISPIPVEYTWQDKPYLWEGFDYTVNWSNYIDDLKMGDYTVTVNDIFACTTTKIISLPLLDNTPPVFRFTNANNTVEEPYNDIHRNAAPGTCTYTPATTTDLDPIMTDDCGTIVDYWCELPDMTTGTTLNGVTLTGTTTVTWYASDGQNTADTTVVYMIDDIELPTFNDPDDHEIDLYLSELGDVCGYLVSGGLVVPSVEDNCAVQSLINNINESATLDGVTLGVGISQISWTVTDQAGNTNTLDQVVNVYDDIAPDENCVTHTAYLDAGGRVRLNAEDLYGSLDDGDNCNVQSISIALNVALGKSSNQSSTFTDDYAPCEGTPDASKANDGKLETDFNECTVSSTDSEASPWWSVDLGDSYDIKRIVIHNRTGAGLSANNLTNFTIEISNASDFSTIEYTETYNSTQEPVYQFDIPVASPESGQYVRVTSNVADSHHLQMAEFEVYGVLAGAATENVALGKTATMISSYHSASGTACGQNVPASRAVDGDTRGEFYDPPCTVTHTDAPFNDWEWWQVDLDGFYRIDRIMVWDRTDPPYEKRLYDFYLLLAGSQSDYPTYTDYVNGRTGDNSNNNHTEAFWDTYPNVKPYYCLGPDHPGGVDGGNEWSEAIPGDTARFVRLWMDHNANPQNLAEVQVFGVRADIPEVYVDCNFIFASPVTAIITATDLSGNTTQCDAQIDVRDIIRPTARTKNITVNLDENGQAVITGADADNGSFDNCGIETYLVEGVEEYILDCTNLAQELTLNLTVIDFAGNQHSAPFNVTVEDKEGPILACPEPTEVVNVYLNNNGELTLTRRYILDYILPGSYDNCGGEAGIITILSDIDNFDCDDLANVAGNFNITITASDIYTNTSTCEVEIAVIDTIAPIARARNVTITVSGEAQYIDVNAVNNGSFDNCKVDSMWLVPDMVDTCYAYIDTLVLYVRDESGNTSFDSCVVNFKPELEIISIGMDDCSGGVGANWVANVNGSPTSYVWECIEAQNGNNWGSNKTECFGPVASSTSIAVSPPYNDPGINNGALRIRLTISDAFCTETVIDTLWLFPGAGQPATTLNYVDDECYGSTATYTVPNVADSYVWSFDSATEGGVFTTPLDGQAVNVTWSATGGNSDFTGIVRCLAATIDGSKTCYSLYVWTVDVYETPDPALQTYGGNSIETAICPNSTVTYEVLNVDANFIWTWNSINKGTIISGGRNNDPTMTVLWGSTLGDVDSIEVIAYNYIGCSDSIVSLAITITDTDPPVFTSIATEFDTIMSTNPGQCVAWLTTLPIPLAQDECGGSVCAEPSCYTLTYSINSSAYKAGNLFNTENLPVGSHTVEWRVADLGGLTNVVPFQYSIDVVDQQAPNFLYNPSDTIINAGDRACYMQFDEPTGCAVKFVRQVTAIDNCPGQVQYRREIWHGGVLVDNQGWRDNFGTVSCPTAPGVGIDYVVFQGGVSTIRYFARDQYGNERAAPPFTITIVDVSPPWVTDLGSAQFNTVTRNNAAGTCGAVVDIGKPANFSTWIDDNCTAPANLTVTATRSDGRAIAWNNTTDEPFPVGETTVVWRIADEIGNFITVNQTVIISDNEPPVFTGNIIPAKLDYTWCEKGTLRLPVPTLSDNCGNGRIDSLRVTVAGPGVYSFTQKYVGVPVQTQTDILPNTVAGDYTVVWNVWGLGGSTTTASTDDEYTIHIEIQPRVNNVSLQSTTCPGATDGRIGIFDITFETGANVYYYINETLRQPADGIFNMNNDSVFTGLSSRAYNYIHIEVNGCKSPYFLASLDQLPAYSIAGTVDHNWCEEATDGEISITTTGGAFTLDSNAGGTFTWHYSNDGLPPDHTNQEATNIPGVTVSAPSDDGTSTISNLPSGQYYVYYTDAGMACNAGRLFTVNSLDNESPDTQGFVTLPLVVETDTDVCTHVITVDEAAVPAWGTVYDNTNLAPATRDEEGCDFVPEYQVINTNGKSEWLTSLADYELTRGGNQVFMQFGQNNKMYFEEYVYGITVVDGQKPTPVTQAISGELDENGQLVISATTLNNGSTDNCPGTLTFKVRKLETEPWADVVIFDCDDVGVSVSVFFKVTDAAGNADSTEISGITITDDIDPTVDILFPIEYFHCATISGSPGYVDNIGDFELDADDYADNCSVTTIDYMVEHPTVGTVQDWTTGAAANPGNAAYDEDGNYMRFYEGKNYIYFRVTDASGGVSAPVRCFIITVYPQPLPDEINE